MSAANGPRDRRGAGSNSYDRACQLLAERILGRAPDNLLGLLNEMPPLLGVKHIAYLRFLEDRSDDVTLLAALSTYPQQWQIRYFTRRYHEIDPLFSACVNATSPFDWRSIRESAPQSADFFADAADHGVGVNGVTIPVRNSANGFATVSFNSDLSDADWDAFKLRNMAKLEVVTCLVDSAASLKTKLVSKRIELSKREHQALTWAARGKTGEEIASIMGVSYASVKTYIEGAKRKLNCENVTHAVAAAMAIGLISPLSLKGFDPSGYSGKVEAETLA